MSDPVYQALDRLKKSIADCFEIAGRFEGTDALETQFEESANDVWNKFRRLEKDVQSVIPPTANPK